MFFAVLDSCTKPNWCPCFIKDIQVSFFSTFSSNPRTPNAMLKPKEKQKMEKSLSRERLIPF